MEGSQRITINHIIIFSVNYLYIAIIAIAIAVLLLSDNSIRKNILKMALLALPISFIIAKILGAIFYNPRPFVVEHIQPLIPHAANNGFPSDHTLLTMTIAGIIFLYHKRLGLLLATLALAVGIARILARVHHPIDIVSAIIIAISSVYLTWYILKKINFNFYEWKPQNTGKS